MKTVNITRALVAGTLAFATVGSAHAESIVIDGSGNTTRQRPVVVADLDLTTEQGKAKLENRIAIAVRRVCNIKRGSALNKLDDARTCVENSHADAWRQIEQRTAMRDTSLGGS